ncbi:MAG: geranylgeranylglyceryl/heptaprenylglyceryl phosphate synthase [Candidatus Altiarchaeota archaeon]|nr:geranylgeranylglyceryl/heptaprenylglyceryl phosphate synthase [Candidatus Altiarchaeota archaeon]
MDLITELLLKKKKKLHFTLIDPDPKKLKSPAEAGERAKACWNYGTDAIMIGGSTLEDKKFIRDCVREIKKRVDIPTIFFPNSADMIPKNTEYIFFMMLLNSRKRRFIIEEQMKGAVLVKNWNIKPVSLAYIVVSTSKEPTTVEKVCDLDRITEKDTEKAVDYALAAKYLNMECIYLEAGSGAEKPVPDDMIAAVKEAADIPVIAGGGIRDAETARAKTKAGADVIVSGTAGEEDCDKVGEIIKAIKS